MDSSQQVKGNAPTFKLTSTRRQRLNAVRDGVLRERDLHSAERVARPSVAEWYAGRSVFLTGGSGFMGRVLIELLLRSCPDIGPIYMLLRPKKGVAPADRLAGLLDVPLFTRLRAEQPAALSKVRVVSGDIEAVSLGLSAADRQLLCREVSVVFHMAASVRFDEPLRQAVLTNLRSTREVVQLARDMPGLKALVHVSTAYTFTNQSPVDECLYPTTLDWKEALRYADLPDIDQIAINHLEEKLLVWHPNTYTLTKSLAEHLVQEAAEHLPVVIIRPSIVTSSFIDPIPGWIDNLNGAGGFHVASAIGLLRYLYGRESPLDSVPVDVATKVVILASWCKGLGVQLSDRKVDVVNATVGNDFGLTTAEISFVGHDLGVEHEVPFPESLRPPFTAYKACPFTYAILHFYHHLLFGFNVDLLSRALGMKPRVLGLYRKIATGLNATAAFRRKPSTFIMSNQRKLQGMIHPSDLETLDFLHIYKSRDNVEELKSLVRNSFRGLLNYALKGRDDARMNNARLKRLKWILYAYHSVMALLFLGVAALLFY